MAKKANSLAHTKWMCKYHIVFTPKYRRKVIYNQLREDIGAELRLGHHHLHHRHPPAQHPSAAQPAEEHGQDVRFPADDRRHPEKVQGQARKAAGRAAQAPAGVRL